LSTDDRLSTSSDAILNFLDFAGEFSEFVVSIERSFTRAQCARSRRENVTASHCGCVDHNAARGRYISNP
jgi:hypothetical protein